MTKVQIKFTHYDLKQQRAGVMVEIALSAVANVRLMNDGNFQLYKEAMKHQFVGGIARKSPIRLVIPQPGHWHVVVDMEGHHGQTDSIIRIVEAQLAPKFKAAGGNG